jgi:NADH:ubiquinone reductase (H+-translocating)
MGFNNRPKVVIIGAGFGGLYAARAFADQPVDVVVIDRHNFHTFTPLLYQVATCGLEAEEIAYPVRGIFRDNRNIQFRLGEVIHFDLNERYIDVQMSSGTVREHYDYLIIAAGSVTNFFNMDDMGKHAFGLKDLEEAVKLRNHILTLFEQAAWTEDTAQREALTTMVVIGGGPTGLELAGAIYELYKNVLSQEYDFLKRVSPRVILVEATDRLLIPFPKSLQAAALEQVKSLGIEVLLSEPVSETGADYVKFKDGKVIQTHTIIWAAGVKASPLAEKIGVPLAKGGRVPVKPTLEVINAAGVYVAGDMAYLEDPKGQAYPMLIPVAKQQGILAAKNILRRIEGEPEGKFHYIDRGIMATIGRSRAVAWLFNRIPVRGYFAWVAWLGLHLITLLGFRNRVNVLTNWIWNYLTYDRSVRIILKSSARASGDWKDALQTDPKIAQETSAQSQGLWGDK